jgi:hypothetical protein
MLAFFVFFRVQHSDQPTLLDYADYMRRKRWKAHSLPQRLKRVGNYLRVVGVPTRFPPNATRLPPPPPRKAWVGCSVELVLLTMDGYGLLNYSDFTTISVSQSRFT